MKTFKVINLFALLCSVVWAAKNPGWDTISISFALLATVIGLEIGEEKKRLKNPDIILFDAFLQVLPSDGNIDYVKQNDMAGPIDMNQLEQLRRFKYDWNNAEHEFINKKLEKKRKELPELIEAFYTFAGVNTWQVKGNVHRVPTEWQQTQPMRYDQVVNQLNSYANQIYTLHQELVRFAKKRLKLS
jgi:hypothetical protein